MLVTIASQFRYRFILSDGAIEKGKGLRVVVPLSPPSIAITVNLRSLRQFSREVILLVSPFFSIVLGLSRVVNNKPFLLSFGESYVFLVYCGSLP